jgi:hypothetical protein
MQSKEERYTELDWFLLSKLLRCPYCYGMYCRQLRKPNDVGPSANFGIAYHKMMEHYYKGQPQSQAIEAGLALLCAEEFDKGPHKRDKLVGLLEAYLLRTQDFRAEHTVVALESKYSAGNHYCAKLDMVTQSKDGLFWIVDHKTSAKGLTADGVNWYLTMDGQTSGWLCVGQYCWQEQFGGIIIQHMNITAKMLEPVVIPPSAERADGFLHMFANRITDASILVTPSTQELDRWPTGCRKMYGQMCEFTEHCTHGGTEGLVEDLWLPGEGWVSERGNQDD